MATKIKHKRSSVSGNIPLPNQLEPGELAVNTADGKIYLRKDDNTVTDTTQSIFQRNSKVLVTDTGNNGLISMVADGIAVTTATSSEFTINKDIIVNESIKLREDFANGSNEIEIKAPASLASSYEFVLPSVAPTLGQVMVSDGQGKFTFEDADTYGGNRVYVSIAKGNDLNDGVTAPVRTLKRALQIASGFVYDQTFVYNEDTCRRDVGLILSAIGYDLTYGGNWQSLKAGLTYYNATASAVTTTQKAVTLAALNQLKQLVLDLPGVSGANETFLSARLDEIINIFDNGANHYNIQTTLTMPNPTGSTVDQQNAKTLLLANVPFIREEVAGWINDKLVGFTYTGTTVTKCERDVDNIVTAAIYDSVLNTNYNAVTAGLSYTRANTSYVTGSQNIQTRYAIKKIIEITLPYTLNTLFETRFTNAVNEVVDIFDNGTSAANALTFPSPTGVDQNLVNAKDQLRANREFIKSEITAWIAQTYPSFTYDVAKCARDVGYIVDALSYDILYGGNSATYRNADSYLVGAVSQLGSGEIDETVAAYGRLKVIINSIVQGILITKSTGNAASQDNTTYSAATSAQGTRAQSLIDVIITVITDGNTTSLNTLTYPVITWASTALQLDHEIVLDNKTLIKQAVSNYITNSFDNFSYDVAKCKRDIEFIIRGMAYDLIYGGTSQTTDATKKYYAYGVGATVIPGDVEASAVAYEYANYLTKRVILNQAPAETFSSEPRVTGTAATTTETDVIQGLFDIIVNGLRGSPSSIAAPIAPTAAENQFNLRQLLIQANVALPIKYKVIATASNYKPNNTKITVQVSAGDYEEDNPLIIPDNVTVTGDSLRSVILRPLNPGLDMLKCRNGAYFGEFTFRDGIAAGVPIRTFDYAIAFDDVTDNTDRWTYDRLPLSKPIITQSPYIQNCSIISFMGGNGALVDGNLVQVPNITPGVPEEQERPVSGAIPEQGKSFVANAFTTLSFGGTGWRLINDAYAQIVSCFQIFMLNGSFAQSGGYLSITNSATNFGIYALRSSGYSPNAFTFDRGLIADVGTTGANAQQTLTLIGMGHEAIEHYVIRVRDFQTRFVGSITNDVLTVTTIITAGPGLSAGSILQAYNIIEGTYIVSQLSGTTGGAGTYKLNNIQTLSSCTFYTTHTDTAEITGNFKDIPTEYSFDAAVDINLLTDIITFSTDHNLTSGDSLEYDPNGNIKIKGLDKGQTYYAEVLTPNSIRVWFDESFKVKVDFTELGTGTHKFLSNVEELYVDGLIESHNTYQILELTLKPGITNYNFTRGTVINAISGGSPVMAYVSYWDPTNLRLVVSIEKITIGSLTYRNPFNDQSSSTILLDHSIVPISNIPVASVQTTNKFYTNIIKVLSTKAGSSFDNAVNLKGKNSYLHRPSIVNSSGHTWEYAGSGIDYNALPQNGGKGDVTYEQYAELPGRVYSSGTNELGDFKVGDFIIAFNRTGTITFKNQVNIAELAVIKLAFSDVTIDTISIDPDLGGNEIGGPGNNRLTTQKAIRTFITNNLGNFIGKQVSTNAQPGAVVQLNAQGQINSDLLPVPNSFQSIISDGYNSRLIEYEDIPANGLNNGDLVTEEFTQQTLTLSTQFTGLDGDIIYQAGTNAYGILKGNVTNSTTIVVGKGNFKGIFGNSSNILAGRWVNDYAGGVSPAAGEFYTNSNFPSMVTSIIINRTDSNAVDQSTALTNLVVGHTISLRQTTDDSYVLYKITSKTTATPLMTYGVRYLFAFGNPIIPTKTFDIGVYAFEDSSTQNKRFYQSNYTQPDSTDAGTIVNVSAGSTTYSVNATTDPIASSLPYFLKKDNDRQYLILDPTQTYSFTPGSTISSAISKSSGAIYDFRIGIVVEINSVAFPSGSGYNTAGVYKNIALTGGSGSGVRANITVANNKVESVDIITGGFGYAVGNTLSAADGDIGGRTGGSAFTATVSEIDKRVYLSRSASSSSFYATINAVDYITDNNSSVKSITQTNSTIKSFNAATNVNYSTYVFTITTHGFSNGDPVVYSANFNLAIGGLDEVTLYFVKVLTANTFELHTTYYLNNIVELTSSSTGTQAVILNAVNTIGDRFYLAAHGYSTGDVVKVTGSTLSTGLTSDNFYYIGSVTVNSFSLHSLKTDALNSVNGTTVGQVDISSVGTGDATFSSYDVPVIGVVNTGSSDKDNWTLISTTDIDANNIVSGVINTSRLASEGFANTETFLRGDSNWAPVVQTLREASDGPIFFLGSGDSSGYYGDIEIDVERVAGDKGDPIYTNLGVAKFLKTQFDVSSDDTGAVLVKDGVIDAIKLNGQPGSYYLDPQNYTGVVPSNKGGTGVNNNYVIALGGEISSVGRIYTVSNISGASRNLTFTLTDDTSLILPTTGTLVTTTGEQTFENKTLVNATIEGTVTILSSSTQISQDSGFFATVTSTNTVNIDTFNALTFRSAKYFIQITQSNNYQTSEIIVSHNGSQAKFTEYGIIENSGILGTYSVDINSNNVRLRVTMGSSNQATFKISRKLITL